MADGLAGRAATPAEVLAEAADALCSSASRDDEARPGGPSLLACGLALAHAEAAAWAVAGAGDAARPLVLHAAALVALAAPPGPRVATVPPPLAASLAAGPAETPRGLAICLAAAGAALRAGGPGLESAAARLLATPRRERFPLRLAAGDELEV